MNLILVRHGENVKDAGQPNYGALTPNGVNFANALNLKILIRGFQIRRIYVGCEADMLGLVATPRCEETVTPLSTRTGVPIVPQRAPELLQGWQNDDATQNYDVYVFRTMDFDFLMDSIHGMKADDMSYHRILIFSDKTPGTLNFSTKQVLNTGIPGRPLH